eukprot:6744139-Pyramimonas_sp.AAC.1
MLSSISAAPSALQRPKRRGAVRHRRRLLHRARHGRMASVKSDNTLLFQVKVAVQKGPPFPRQKRAQGVSSGSRAGARSNAGGKLTTLSSREGVVVRAPVRERSPGGGGSKGAVRAREQRRQRPRGDKPLPVCRQLARRGQHP